MVMASGRPSLFIGATDGEVAGDIQHHSCGRSITPGDAEKLYDAFLSYRCDADLLKQHGDNARKYFDEVHADAKSREHWVDLLLEYDS